jgi:hypothetical protein
MALFGRKKAASDPSSAVAATAPSARVAQPVPLDLEGVRAEWEATPEEGFTQGWAFFDNPNLPPGQALNGAEYMTRGLRAELHRLGSAGRDASTIREGCRRTVILAGRTPPEIGWQDEFAPKFIRLGLMLIKLHGWQPVQYGGDGSITDADLDVHRPDLLIAAIAPSASSASEALQAFFARPL